jgi:hypothetical protein
MRQIILSSFLLILSCHLFADIQMAQAGDGYSYDNGRSVQKSCLNLGNSTYSGKNSGMLYVFRPLSIQSTRASLGVRDQQGNYTIDAFADIPQVFNNFLQDNDLAESFVYESEYVFKSKHANPQEEGLFHPNLNDYGKQAWLDGADNFRAQCGDSYVSEANYGAKIYIAFQFHFLTKQDKDNFDAQFSPYFSHLDEFLVQLQKHPGEASDSVHVMADQEGGDTEALDNLFTSTSPTIKNSQTLCPLNNLKNCTDLMNRLVEYEAASLPSQFPISSAQEPPSSAVITSIVTQPYTSLDSDLVTTSQLTKAITDARNELGQQYDLDNAQWQRSEFLNSQMLGGYAYGTYKEQLSDYSFAMAENLQSIEGGTVSGCFIYPIAQCPTIATATINNLHPTNPDLLKLPERIIVSEVYGNTVTQYAFVVAPDSPKTGLRQFLGMEIAPEPQNSYDINVQSLMSGTELSMVRKDHITQKTLAVYDGYLSSTAHYFTGTVTYPASGEHTEFMAQWFEEPES